MKGIVIYIYIVMSVMCCAAAQARDVIYDKSMAMAEGVHMMDTIAGRVRDAVIVVRAKTERRRGAREWGVLWNYRGERDYVKAVIKFGDMAFNDGIYDESAVLSVVKVVDGVETVLSDLTVDEGLDFGDGFNSFRLVVDDVSARLYIGSRMQRMAGIVPFDRDIPGAVGIVGSCGLQCSRVSVTYDVRPDRQFARFESIEEMDGYLKSSSDAIEGYWRYLDRDNDRRMAMPGGEYILSIIGNSDGSYDMYYVSGAKVNSGNWIPLQLKGRLIPTVFVNHFDLVWRDAMEDEMSAEQSATISDGSLLTLNFPLYDTQLRFCRVIKDY